MDRVYWPSYIDILQDCVAISTIPLEEKSKPKDVVAVFEFR